MDLAELQKKLMGAARRNPPGDQVPFAFEQRIMARLKSVAPLDEWALWARALWCGAGACAVITLALCLSSFVPGADIDSVASFSQDLEQTILVSTDEGNATW
jgi:hypothetical protein